MDWSNSIPIVIASFCVLVTVVLLLSMDIQNASRALWSAYGQFADKVKQGRMSRGSSETEFSEYAQVERRDAEDAASPATMWPIEHHDFQNPLNAFPNLDQGHFTNEEFLRRFGGGPPCLARNSSPSSTPPRTLDSSSTKGSKPSKSMLRQQSAPLPRGGTSTDITSNATPSKDKSSPVAKVIHSRQKSASNIITKAVSKVPSFLGRISAATPLSTTSATSSLPLAAESKLPARQKDPGTEELEEPDPGPIPDIANPEPLHTGTYTPELTEASAILDERQCNALAAAVPIRHRWRRWKLAYSTARDGVSLRTLFRNSSRAGPSITVVRDRDGYVFGCFCSEGWRVAPRYYGSGECFVFQLKPEMVLWRWYQKKMAISRNDYYQYSTPDCIAIGGAPAYALKLDGDLTLGRSGISETFGNVPLAGAEEFQIGRVEVWALV